MAIAAVCQPGIAARTTVLCVSPETHLVLSVHIRTLSDRFSIRYCDTYSRNPEIRPDAYYQFPMPSEIPRKSTLFCPTCDHQSPVGGDWTVVETSRYRRIRCPDCGTEVVNQPTGSGRDPPVVQLADWPTLRAAWRSSLRAIRIAWARVLFPSRR